MKPKYLAEEIRDGLKKLKSRLDIPPADDHDDLNGYMDALVEDCEMLIFALGRRQKAAKNPSSQGGLRPAQAADYIGCSRSYIYRLMETDPDFPRPIKLSNRCVMLTKQSLDEYLAKKHRGES